MTGFLFLHTSQLLFRCRRPAIAVGVVAVVGSIVGTGQFSRAQEESAILPPSSLADSRPQIGGPSTAVKPAHLEFLNWKSRKPAASSVSFVLPEPRLPAAKTNDYESIFDEIKLSKSHLEKLLSYQKALQLNSSESCSLFKKLSDDSDFGRRDLAKLRYWILCSSQVTADANVSDILIDQKPWLADVKLQAEMVVAESAGKWDEYFSLLSQQIRKMRSLRPKTKALEEGLLLAEKKDRKVEAEEFRTQLEKLAPRFIKNPKPTDFLEVGQDWILVREFDKGRSYLKKVLASKKSSQSQKRRAFQSFRNSYKVQQNKPQHLIEAEKYYRWLIKNKETDLAADSGLYWVRALWTEGQKDRAIREMKKMEPEFARRKRLHELDFIRGRMAEEESQFKTALGFYDKALIRGAKDTPQEIKVEASRAWALRRLGQHAEAAKAFELIAKNAPEPSDQIRARFWQAKSLSSAGQTEQATSAFRQVAFDDPVGYYGLIAFHELKTAIPPLSSSREETLKGWNSLVEKADAEALAEQTNESPAPMNDTNPTAALAELEKQPAKILRSLSLEEKLWISDLHWMGEKQVLQSYLDGLAEDQGWDYTTTEGLKLLQSYARSGLYLPLFATIGKIEKQQREKLLLSHPELLFPRDYSEPIHAAAAQQEIPPELIFSIIRQESAFNPNARSFADAMGLMQILPMQAKVVSKELKMDFDGHEDLYVPEKNIPIGARMLRQGLNRYDGNFILAIASYNANDRAIRGWLKSRFREDPVEFIEEIAYEETRSYVKLVLRNYIFYKRLQNPDLALGFPPECLPDLQKFKHSKGEGIVSR